MIVFDAGEVYPSISYYVQSTSPSARSFLHLVLTPPSFVLLAEMFSTHRSEIILPTTIQNGSTPYALNWVAGVNYERSLLFVKASNFGEETIPLAFEFGADWNTKNATVEILKSDNATAWNKPNIENRVEPELTPVELYNGKLNYDMVRLDPARPGDLDILLTVPNCTRPLQPPYSVAVFSVAF